MPRTTPAGDSWVTGEEFNAFATLYRLSSRQLVTVVLFLKDSTRKGIAKRLRIKLNSVNKHCDRLFKKLGVRSRVGVVVELIRIVLAKRQRPKLRLAQVV